MGGATSAPNIDPGVTKAQAIDLLNEGYYSRVYDGQPEPSAAVRTLMAASSAAAASFRASFQLEGAHVVARGEEV
jgi:hypothetical protein